MEYYKKNVKNLLKRRWKGTFKMNKFKNMTEEQAKKEILDLVKQYCDTYHNVHKTYRNGDRISYASRVYDSSEMCNLVDSALEFWLTAGRYTDMFEKKFAKYLDL